MVQCSPPNLQHKQLGDKANSYFIAYLIAIWMLLVFEVFSTAVISQIEPIGGGQVGNRRRAKAKIHDSYTNGSALPLVGVPDWHYLPSWPGLESKSIWHAMQSY